MSRVGVSHHSHFFLLPPSNPVELTMKTTLKCNICLLFFVFHVTEKHSLVLSFATSRSSALVGSSPARPTSLKLPRTIVPIQATPSEEQASGVVPYKDLSTAAIMPLTLIGKTTSLLVSASVFCAIAYFRDAITFSLFLGSVSNGILSKILKRFVNQSRPADISDAVTTKPADKGMPSSHAMSLGFICTFAACQVAIPAIQWSLLVYAVVSLVYRVHVKLHTTAQVMVGGILGTVNGYMWWRLTVGDNPWSINVADWITANVLDEATGLLPYPMLLVPLVVGGLIVGSFE